MKTNIYQSIDSIHMNESEKNKIRNAILENYTAPIKASKHITLKRYATCAAILFCFICVSATVYAASNFGYFNKFFDNGTDETVSNTLQNLLSYATTDNVVTENEKYKITVQANLYSEKQEMGLAICSIILKTKESNEISVCTDSGYAYLSSEKVVTDETKTNDNYYADITDTNGFVETYYLGEKAKDGGYLCGIRYCGKNCLNQVQMILVKGDVEKTITEFDEIKLPASSEMPCLEMTSEKYKKSKIILSSIGITFKDMGNQDGYMNYNPDTEGQCILHHISIVTKSSQIKISDLILDTGLETRNETTNLYTFYQPFSRLLNLDNVTGIQYTNETNTILFTK